LTLQAVSVYFEAQVVFLYTGCRKSHLTFDM